MSAVPIAFYRALPARAPAVPDDEAHKEEWRAWRTAVLAAAARENPAPWVRLWVRCFTECGLAARNLRAVADVACALWALPVVDPEIVSFEDVLVRALYTVSAGTDRPLAAIGATAIGLGTAVPKVAHALRWRYPDQVQYCRARGLHGWRADSSPWWRGSSGLSSPVAVSLPARGVLSWVTGRGSPVAGCCWWRDGCPTSWALRLGIQSG